MLPNSSNNLKTPQTLPQKNSITNNNLTLLPQISKIFEYCKSGNLEELKKIILKHRELINIRKPREIDLDREQFQVQSQGQESLAQNQTQDPNQVNSKGSTPLHIASGYNYIQIVKFLLANGADILAKDNQGLLPLHNASCYGHLEIVEILLNSFSENHKE